jgi:hypothetical protein
VSYYALFQGWLLLSQPPGCLRPPTTLSTQRPLGALSWRSGLLPSRRRRLAPAASLVHHLARHGIRSLVGVGNRQTAPSPSSALPPRQSRPHLTAGAGSTAVPPYISGRTSYLRVRLEFLPYPQVIPPFCNTGGCGPRRGLTRASPCPWIAHPVSGLIPATRPAPWLERAPRPLQTRFRCGSTALCSPPSTWEGGPLNLETARCPDQLAGSFYKRHAVRAGPAPPRPCRPTLPSDCLWVLGFRISFIPPAGCFSPFPHGTRALSVART